MYLKHTERVIATAVSALTFWNCEGVYVLKTTFKGRGNVNESLVKAIYSRHANVTIANCFFKGNTGDTGGAMYVEQRSNITIEGTTFTQNKATIDGGAIFIRESSIRFEATIRLKEETAHSHPTVFSSNWAQYYGGAIYLNDSLATMSSSNITFTNNSANEGGAMWCLKTTLNSNAMQLSFIENRAKSLGGARYKLNLLFLVPWR